MAQMHPIAAGLIDEVRLLSMEDSRYANWERGFVCGQISMLSILPSIEYWQVVYLQNLYRAKNNPLLTGA